MKYIFIVLSCLINVYYTKYLYSILGAVTDNSFKLKSVTSDGNSFEVILNENSIGIITPKVNSNSNYYYDFYYDKLLPGTFYELKMKYGTEFIEEAKKNFTTPSPINNLTFSVLSYQEKTSERNSFNQLNKKSFDFTLFLGGIHRDYKTKNSIEDLQEKYLDSKIFI